MSKQAQFVINKYIPYRFWINTILPKFLSLFLCISFKFFLEILSHSPSVAVRDSFKFCISSARSNRQFLIYTKLYAFQVLDPISNWYKPVRNSCSSSAFQVLDPIFQFTQSSLPNFNIVQHNSQILL